MRPGAELEHHRGEAEPLDRGPHGTTLVGELAQGGADEHPQSLVRGSDHKTLAMVLTLGHSWAHHGAISLRSSTFSLRTRRFESAEFESFRLAGRESSACVGRSKLIEEAHVVDERRGVDRRRTPADARCRPGEPPGAPGVPRRAARALRPSRQYAMPSSCRSATEPERLSR
jgi:hypothetical protein